MARLKRILLWLVLTGAAALLVFGPRPRLDGPPDRVVVDYWEKWGGLEGSQMQQIVDAFNETVGRDKGIFVRYLSVSSINEKTLVATAAGVPPDIAGMWESNVPQFAALGALEPLDELAAAYGITETYYKPVYWRGCQYEGRLYALVSTPWVLALHWDKRAYREAADRLRAEGLDPDRAPRTIAELDAYAKVLDVVDANGWVSRAGYLPMHPGWFNLYMPFWFGGTLYDPATRRLLLDDEASIKAYRWIRSYSERFGVQAMTDFRSSLTTAASATDPFIVGTVAMEISGPWRANYLEDLAPHLNRWKMSKEEERRLPHRDRHVNYTWGAAPFPSADGRPNVGFAGYDILTIPRGARHKREAFEFIAYVNRQEVMERLCSMHSKNSPLREVSRSFLENHPNPYVEVFETLAASPYAYTVPSVPVWPEVAQELNDALQRVFLLQKTPEEALHDAQERSQRRLDRFFEMERRRAGRGGAPS